MHIRAHGVETRLREFDGKRGCKAAIPGEIGEFVVCGLAGGLTY